LVVGMPLAAALAYRRRRRPADPHDAAGSRRRWLAPAVLCLAGCLTAAGLTFGVSAVTHAHIAEAVRWSPDFLSRLVFFDEQAIVVIAVACALIAAATARSAVGVALSVVVPRGAGRHASGRPAGSRPQSRSLPRSRGRRCGDPERARRASSLPEASAATAGSAGTTTRSASSPAGTPLPIPASRDGCISL